MQKEKLNLQERALEIARLGFAPIPVKGKVAFVTGWQKAGASAASVESFGKQWNVADGIAIVTGPNSGNVVVLDIDDKQLAEKILEEHGLRERTLVLSTRRGVHIYVRESGFSSSKGKLDKGVPADLQAKGACAVLYDSDGFFAGHTRIMTVDNARSWAKSMLGIKDRKEAAKQTGERVTKGGRNDDIMPLLYSLRDAGKSREQMLEELEEYTQEHHSPPLERRELEQKIDSAIKNPKSHTSSTGSISSIYISLLQVREDTCTQEELNADIDWTWLGILGRELVSLISSPAKCGKSTLVFHLFRAMHEGRMEFLGQSLKGNQTVLLFTEEARPVMLRRKKALGITDFPILTIAPHQVQDWSTGTVEAVRDFIDTKKISLVVVDTLSCFWKLEDENSAVQVNKALEPFCTLARVCKVPVLLLHHTRKSFGDKAVDHRGSSALLARVNIALRLEDTRKAGERKLTGTASHLEETPRSMIIKLINGEYRKLGTEEEVNADNEGEEILTAMPSEGPPLTVKEIASRRYGKATQHQVKKTRIGAEKLVKSGRLRREGTGTPKNPYRYSIDIGSTDSIAA